MKIKSLLFISIINMLAMASLANAQAPVSDNILTLTHVDAAGKALVEFPTGQRLIAKEGMSLPEGARVLVLERGTVRGLYHKANCEVEFRQNTVLQVTRHDPCGAGALSGMQKAGQMPRQVTQMPRQVSQGASQVSQSTTLASGNAGCCCVTNCCTVKRIVTRTPKTVIPPVISTGAAAPTIASSSFFSGVRPLYILGGVAGLAGLVVALDDDDDDKPVSP